MMLKRLYLEAAQNIDHTDSDKLTISEMCGLIIKSGIPFSFIVSEGHTIFDHPPVEFTHDGQRFVVTEVSNMPKSGSWEVVVKSLRLHFLQGNSHIDNIDEWIEEQVEKTIQDIRKTPRAVTTKSVMEQVEGR